MEEKINQTNYDRDIKVCVIMCIFSDLKTLRRWKMKRK